MKNPANTIQAKAPLEKSGGAFCLNSSTDKSDISALFDLEDRYMPAIVSSAEVEAVLRDLLTEQGYMLSAERKFGETGSDIIATRGQERIHIEAIAFKSSPPARSKDFYEVFFRAISRLDRGATLCVIALPSRFGSGLHQRAAAIGMAWKRIGEAFPELAIWLVDTQEKAFVSEKWNTWTSAGFSGSSRD